MSIAKFRFDAAIEEAIKLYRAERADRIKKWFSTSAERELAARAARRKGLASKNGSVLRIIIDVVREIGNDYPGPGNPNHIRLRNEAWSIYSKRLCIAA